MKTHRVDGLTYGHFGDGCVHVRIDFPFAAGPQRFREFVVDAARLVGSHGGSMSGEHGDGRARGELLPHMYSPEAIATFAQIKGLFDPTDLLNPGVIVDPRAVDADLRVPLARPLRDASRLRLPARRRRPVDRRAPLRRRRQVPRRHHRWRRGDVPVLPRHARREGLHARTGARAAGARQRLAGRAASRSDELPDVARPVPVVQGLLVGLPGRRRHGDLQGRGAAPALPQAAAAGVALRARLAAALGQAGVARPRAWPTHRCATARSPRLAKRARRHRRAPTAAAFAGADVPRVVRQARRCAPAARRSCSGSTPSPTTSRPRSGRAAVRVLEDAGYRVQLTDKRGLLRAHLDLAPASSTAPSGSCGARLDALEPALRERMPIVGLEPSCTAVLRNDVAELLPDDPRAAQVARRRAPWPSCWPRHRGWTPPRLDGVRAVAQPHCHQHAVMGWTPDAALLADAGADVDGGRRLLRAGRQLRRRAGPLRRVGGGGRDGAAARRPRRAPTTPSCWPTASRAAPSSTSWPQRAAASHLAQLLADASTADGEPMTRTGFVPPPYPYDRLDEIVAIADAHDGGAVDLSIGTPCDPPPADVLAALAARRQPPAATRPRSAPPALRAGRRGLDRAPPRRHVDPATEIAACVGTKEFVASRAAVPQAARPRPRHRAVPGDQLPDLRDGRDARRAAARCRTCTSTTSARPTPRARCASGSTRRPTPPASCTTSPPPRRGDARAASRCCPTSATPSSPGRRRPTTILRDGTAGRAGGALAVQARQLRRRPDRLLRRRPRARALPARGPQARRPDAARAGAGRGRRRPRRRRARRARSASATCAGWPRCGDMLGRCRLPVRAARRRVLPLGRRARRRRLGRGPRPRRAGRASSSRPASSTARTGGHTSGSRRCNPTTGSSWPRAPGP